MKRFTLISYAFIQLPNEHNIHDVFLMVANVISFAYLTIHYPVERIGFPFAKCMK